jgi:hypothetical protein
MKKVKHTSILQLACLPRSPQYHCCLRNSDAVSEVVGTVLLIGIGISLFTVLAAVVLNTSFAFYTGPSPTVSISGHVDITGGSKAIVLEHLGGSELPGDTKIIFNIGGIIEECTVSTMAGLPSGNTNWCVGEKLVYTIDPADHDLYDYIVNLKQTYVSVLIQDVKTNTVILNTVIQNGYTSLQPEVDASLIEKRQTSANISLFYNFKCGQGLDLLPNSKSYNFQYYDKTLYPTGGVYQWVKTSGGVDEKGNTSIPDILPFQCTGSNYTLLNPPLVPGHTYVFRAVIQYDIFTGSYDSEGHKIYNHVVVYSNEVTFTTRTFIVGNWKFNEGTGSIVHDSSGNKNNISLYPGMSFALWIRPKWQTPPDSLNNTIDGNATKFDGLNDYGTFSNSNKKNLNLTTQATVEAWIKPLKNSTGTYNTCFLLNSSTFGNPNQGFNQVEIAPVANQIFVLVSRGYAYYPYYNNPHGCVATVHIAANGSVEPAIGNVTSIFLDVYEFESTNCISPQIIQVDSSPPIFTYAIVYNGSNNKGVIKLIQVNSSSGKITPITLPGSPNGFIFDASYCIDPDVIKVDNSVDHLFAISYTQQRFGRVKIVQISKSSGFWSCTNISMVDFSSVEIDDSGQPTSYAFMSQTDIIHLAGTLDYVYAIVYNGPDTDGYIRRINISSAGVITAVKGDYYCFDKVNGFFPQILYVAADDIYTIVYGGSLGNESAGRFGILLTVQINPSGTFRSGVSPQFYTQIDHETVEILNTFYDPRIVSIGNGYFAVVYKGNGGWGYLKTYHIDSTSGDITIPSGTQSVNFAYSEVPYPNIISVGVPDSVVAIFYPISGGSDRNNGIIKTYPINSTGSIGALIDFHKLGVPNMYSSNFAHVSGDLYAIVYADQDATYVKTFHISSDGQTIGRNFLSNLEIESSPCWSFDILNLGANGNSYYFAIFYRKDDYPVLRVIMIDGNPNSYTISNISVWTDWANQGYFTKIVRLSSSIYATMYDDYNNNTLRLMTWKFSITPVTFTPQYGLFFNSSNEYGISCSDILVIDQTEQRVLFVYTNISSIAMMRTMKIDLNSGIILNSSIYEASFDNNIDNYRGCYSPQILQVHDNVYAVFYITDISEFRCQTFQMLVSGGFNVLDPFDKAIVIYADVGQFTVHVSGENFTTLVVNRYSSSLRFLSYRITPAGELGLSRYHADSLSSNSFLPTAMILIDNQKAIYALVGRSNSDDGMINTLQIKPYTGLTNVLRNQWFKFEANSTVVKASVMINTKTMNRISYSIELPLHYSDNTAAWHYIALTYNATSNVSYPVLTFYHYYNTTDGTLHYDTQSLICNPIGLYPIQIGSPLSKTYAADFLVMGEYNAIYDEIKIHSVAQPESYFHDYYTSILRPQT